MLQQSHIALSKRANPLASRSRLGVPPLPYSAHRHKGRSARPIQWQSEADQGGPKAWAAGHGDQEQVLVGAIRVPGSLQVGCRHAVQLCRCGRILRSSGVAICTARVYIGADVSLSAAEHTRRSRDAPGS